MLGYLLKIFSAAARQSLLMTEGNWHSPQLLPLFLFQKRWYILEQEWIYGLTQSIVIFTDSSLLRWMCLSALHTLLLFSVQ